MSKYYISISEQISEYASSSKTALESAKQSIRDGKLFDAMDRINELDRHISSIQFKTESLSGYLKLDEKEFKEARVFMEDYLIEHIGEHIDPSSTDDIELLQIFLYHVNKEEADSKRLSYNQILVQHLKQIAKSNQTI